MIAVVYFINEEPSVLIIMAVCRIGVFRMQNARPAAFKGQLPTSRVFSILFPTKKGTL